MELAVSLFCSGQMQNPGLIKMADGILAWVKETPNVPEKKEPAA